MSYELVVALTIVCIVVFLVILPAVNVVFSLLIMAKPDAKNGEQLSIEGRNSEALSGAYIRDNKLYLRRANGVREIAVDVIFFGRGKKKKSYVVSFNGNVACIDPNLAFENAKVIVLKVDGRVINKKKVGYPNNIINLVTSVGLLIGVAVPCVLHAIYHSYEILEANPGYVVFYLVPVVVGLLVGAAHYILVRLVTKSFNK